MKKLLFTLASSFLICSQLQCDPIVGAYYENWSQYRPANYGRPVFWPNLIDPNIVTDIYFAFGFFGFVSKSIDPTNPHLTGDYTVQPVEWNDQSVLYGQVTALKQQNPKLRVILSIGGWSFNDPNDPNVGAFTYKLFSQMVASSANRKQFIDSCISYAHQWGFDGMDLDWEYPGDLTRGGTAVDFDNYVTLLSECSTAFKAANPPLLLTAATAAAVPGGVPQKYRDNPATYYAWLAKCAPYLDRFNVMAYDYHGAFDVPQITGVNAPLDRDNNPNSLLYIAQTVKYYLDNGVPANKMVLGMPTYGRSFGGVASLSITDNGPGLSFTGPGAAGPSTGQPGLLAYFEIADMISLKQMTFGVDTPTSTAYCYNISGEEWVSNDTPDTIALKVQLIKNNNLLGGMFWAVDMDEYYWSPTYPNVRKAYDLLYPKVKR